ncbi:hypothetical protein TNCV_1497841 [Trichonephila clavipes]|nr:hypothetical protein TNCV_1497841 [Trichonephila clavipes]
MKCMYLGKKIGDMSTQRDKPFNLGMKSREHANSTRQALQSRREKQGTCQLNKTSPPIWVSRKSVEFQHGALGNVIVLVHLIMQVVREGAVIQIPEMGQYFQVDGKKSKLLKNFSLVRALDDDETSVSFGQVTKLAPDAESRYSRGTDPGRWLFKLSRSLMYLLARLSLAVVRRFEWSTVRQMISGSLPSSGMLAVDRSIGTG